MLYYTEDAYALDGLIHIMDSTLFYTDKPLFGLDIGFRTVKVMQVETSGDKHEVTGYGVAEFDEAAVQNGVIVDFDHIAKAIHGLFSAGLVGEISTRRVAMGVPAARTFSRILSLPLLAQKDIKEAVKLEAEQYIPVPIDDLYIDFTIITKNEKTMDVLAVAVPKKLIDSYSTLCRILNLEPVIMETTTGATNRLFRYTDQHDIPTVLIDFGSVATDISIYDKHLAVTGTVAGGGDTLTELISKALNVSRQEAQVIKVRYGLGASKKQPEIIAAATPLLEKTIKEVRRMIRYYEERSEKHGKIEQIVTFGGGANVPGLSEYLIDNLRVPVRACDPWSNLIFKHIKPPAPVEQSMYLTAASLALIKPKEVAA